MASFRIFIENGSKVVKSHLNNLIGTIVNYTGTMPQYVAPNPVSDQLFTHVADTINRGYQLAGVSQLTASSLKPAGIDSGKGLRTLIENEGDRFIPVQRAYEQMYVDLAKLTLEVVSDITKGGKRKYEVKAEKGDSYVKINWKDISLDPEDYAIKAYPVNALSEEPEGRFQDIQELVQAGLMTPQEGRRLLNYPDLKSVSSLDNAVLDLLHQQMDEIIFDGTPQTVEPEDNLDEALKIGLETYAWARKMKVEEEKLSLIRSWIQQCQDLKTAQNPAPQAGAAAPGGVGAPQASAPVAPAPNPMLPNAPGVPQ
jgi:polyhydroxyalkanoate synthesis regulator phasin